MTDIMLSIYDNEDAVRTITLPLNQFGLPTNLNLYTLTSDIVDLRTRAVMLHLSSDEGDGLISRSDAANGVFTLTVPHGSILANPQQRLGFDVLIQHKETGEITRSAFGTLVVNKGETTPR